MLHWRVESAGFWSERSILYLSDRKKDAEAVVAT